QDLIIKAFKKLKVKSKKFSDYKLVLAGGLKKEDQGYFDSLKELTSGDSSIIFKPNLPLYELYELYKLSNYFWHFTGFGVDENKNPELVEHLGIAPLEAMASGCLTFCYSAGGLKELIKDGENGFLFSDVDELINKMIKVNSDEPFKKEIRNFAISFVKKQFSYTVFKSKIKDSLI
ncbi:MAG: glycosyltransferase, partial [Candidatus Roizmanbacteria bacterium]|nr:glycosyltransferase [Candidatus Roizmanbacteria bacterium]